MKGSKNQSTGDSTGRYQSSESSVISKALDDGDNLENEDSFELFGSVRSQGGIRSQRHVGAKESESSSSGNGAEIAASPADEVDEDDDSFQLFGSNGAPGDSRSGALSMKEDHARARTISQQDEDTFELFGKCQSGEKPSDEPARHLEATVGHAVVSEGNCETAKGLYLNLPVVPMDKFDNLRTSAVSEWGIVVTLHQPGQSPMHTMTSKVAANQAKLVITELRTKMRSGQPSDHDEGPSVSSVLIAGMRQLAVLDNDDIKGDTSPLETGPWEGVIEVICRVGSKVHVAYRARGLITSSEASALSSALRRLENLQRHASSPRDPSSSTLAGAIIAGLLTWDL